MSPWSRLCFPHWIVLLFYPPGRGGQARNAGLKLPQVNRAAGESAIQHFPCSCWVLGCHLRIAHCLTNAKASAMTHLSWGSWTSIQTRENKNHRLWTRTNGRFFFFRTSRNRRWVTKSMETSIAWLNNHVASGNLLIGGELTFTRYSKWFSLKLLGKRHLKLLKNLTEGEGNKKYRKEGDYGWINIKVSGNSSHPKHKAVTPIASLLSASETTKLLLDAVDPPVLDTLCNGITRSVTSSVCLLSFVRMLGRSFLL